MFLWGHTLIGLVAVGLFLVLKTCSYFYLWWNGDFGSNNRAELIALWGSSIFSLASKKELICFW